MVAHTDVVSPNGQRPDLPKKVQIDGTAAFAPNELRVLKAMSGKTLEQIMNDEVDAIQAMVWCALRDEGFTDVTWEEAGNVKGEMVPPEQVDPSTGSDSKTSLPSAGSGDALPETSTG